MGAILPSGSSAVLGIAKRVGLGDDRCIGVNQRWPPDKATIRNMMLGQCGARATWLTLLGMHSAKEMTEARAGAYGAGSHAEKPHTGFWREAAGGRARRASGLIDCVSARVSRRCRNARCHVASMSDVRASLCAPFLTGRKG